MITVENIGAIIPVQRKHKEKPLGTLAKRTIDRYKAAYKRVYGVSPEITVDGKWYRIKGFSAGVSRMRLKEMAQQLEYRAGDSDDGTN